MSGFTDLDLCLIASFHTTNRDVQEWIDKGGIEVYANSKLVGLDELDFLTS